MVPHLTNGETEAGSAAGTCSRPHIQFLEERGSKPRLVTPHGVLGQGGAGDSLGYLGDVVATVDGHLPSGHSGTEQ